uniref:Uncharacterized protein n=1 Tax=Pristhesancus plagipennis TaxID=1955184 RepID=A0A2K8JMD8_PRIPG|nr:secreted hypothetical protein [Pristhesancus plagipennis]
MLAALFLLSLLSSSFAGYFPRTPRFYNWLNQQGEVIYSNLPGVVGDEKYPQQYPEMGDDFGPDASEFIQFVQDYDPLEHYPYVNDPYEGYGPSNDEENHSKHEEVHPEDQYPYVNDPYEGEGPQDYYEQQEIQLIPLLGRGLNA